MTPIRPNTGQLPQPAAPRSVAEARAAFFQAMLSAPAAVPAVRVQTPAVAETPVRVRPEPAAADATTYRRPGSLLDIKV